jgi:hypothetical protein
VEVTFDSYYKFSFFYSADLGGGKTLKCKYGGNSEDIYGHEVSRGIKDVVKELSPDAGSVFVHGVGCVEEFGYETT